MNKLEQLGFHGENDSESTSLVLSKTTSGLGIINISISLCGTANITHVSLFKKIKALFTNKIDMIVEWKPNSQDGDGQIIGYNTLLELTTNLITLTDNK